MYQEWMDKVSIEVDENDIREYQKKKESKLKRIIRIIFE